MNDTGAGIGRLTHEEETLQRAKAIEAYEARAKKGKGGTRMGKKKVTK